MIRSSVVLPHPDGPTIDVKLPAGRSTSTPSRTLDTSEPRTKLRETERTDIAL